MENYYFITIGIISGVIIGYLLSSVYFRVKIYKKRKEAINQSKSVILGQVHEKIAPILPEFKYSFKDLVFIGKGIDYVIFDGLSQGDLKQIVFMEIKTGKSQLNNNEKQIRQTIEKGYVKYEVMKI